MKTRSWEPVSDISVYFNRFEDKAQESGKANSNQICLWSEKSVIYWQTS